MIHMIREHAEPLNDALKAYGIDLDNTPSRLNIEWTNTGIILDQYVPNDDFSSGVLVHERDSGMTSEPVVVRKFFPHPGPSDKWTVIPEARIDDADLPGPRVHGGSDVIGRKLHHDTIADALKDYYGVQS